MASSTNDRLLERVEDAGSDSDWDRSVVVTPRNSVIFPAESDATPTKPQGHARSGSGTRTLSELLKLHAEKGTQCAFTQEEALRVGDVLGEWINSSSSPYEGEDDFFVRGKDDLFIPSRRIEAIVEGGRPRGLSESSAGRS